MNMWGRILISGAVIIGIVGAIVLMRQTGAALGDAPGVTDDQNTTQVEESENAMDKTIYVGAQWVDCMGVGPMKCLQVKDTPAGKWQLFYDQIEGFTFEPGFEYVLRVKQEQLQNVPADASSLKWTLVDVIGRTPAAVRVTPEETEWQLQAIVTNGVAAKPVSGSAVTLLLSEGRIGGNASCNRYMGSYEINGQAFTLKSPLATTRMACLSDELNQQEQAFLTALAAVQRYELTDQTLRLFFGEGSNALVFARS